MDESLYHQARVVLNSLTDDERKTFCLKYAYGHLTYGQDYHVSYKKGSRFLTIEKAVKDILFNHLLIVGKYERHYKYYEGMLGHCYRTIFQMSLFVDKQDILTFDDKYQYVKMLTAQMSDYKQIQFYYDALSNMGHSWIARTVETEGPDGEIIKDTLPYSLIIKYRIIKNIPHFFDNFYADLRTFFKEEIRNWESEWEDLFFEKLKQMD